MGRFIARVGEFFTTVGRQAIPLGGVFNGEWQPVSAIAVYWVESLLLALVAAALGALIQWRSSEEAIARARAEGDDEEARAMEAELAAARAAGIKPADVLAFHVGSLILFGIFLSMVIAIAIGNGHLKQRFEVDEFRQGAIAMAIMVALGFSIDLWRFRSMTVRDVQSRVNACMGRWGLFWILGFFGVGLMMLTGRGTVLVAMFGGLKLTWEVWGMLARTFGWQSHTDRGEADRASTR